MKKIVWALFITVLSIGDAKKIVAEKRFETNLVVDNKTLLISAYAKDLESISSALIFYKLDSKKTSVSKLPKTYENRVVIALAAHKDPSLFFVVTQWQRGDLDEPQLHLWNSKKNTWQDLATLNCRNYEKINLSAGRIDFTCAGEKKSFVHQDIKVLEDVSNPISKINLSENDPGELQIVLKKNPTNVVLLKAEKLF
jgi:hypothetical protein